MKLQAGILIVAVFIGSSKVAEGNPYVTELWRKGVATVRNLVLGPAPAPWHQEAVWRIEFDPDAGLRKAPDYQRYFGQRGESLVQLLGSGNYRPGNSQMSSRSVNVRTAQVGLQN